jgi:very-short-patch-repair endonuclease
VSDQRQVEKQLWVRLRNRRLAGWKWKRQVPRGNYIVDFLCVEAALVVERDGGVHEAQREYDARRTRYLEGLGLRVLRFPNAEITENLDGVCDAIFAACGDEAPDPALSP